MSDTRNHTTRDQLAEVLARALDVSDMVTTVPLEDHLADALLASDAIAAVRAAAWDQGYETGYDDRVFEDRGLSTDPDAHEYPHTNPWRVK